MKAKKLVLLTAFTALGSLCIAQTLTHVHDWSLGRGDDGYESGEDIVVSSDEYNYTTGVFEQTVDFHPFTSASGSVISNGGRDVYICKRNKDGNFGWVKSFGGTSTEDVVAIDIDSESNIYVTGRFYGTVDFDPSPTSSFTMTQTGGALNADVYICKFDENGSFIWAKQLEGTGLMESTDIVVDGRNDVHVTGYFHNQVDVNPAPSIFGMQLLTSSGSGDKDGFSVTLDQNGIYKKSYHLKGANSDVSIEALFVDAVYNQLFTGDFSGTCDFDQTSAVYNMSSTGTGTDAFIMRVNPFNGFEWSKQLECSKGANAKAIEMDSNGDVYSVGTFKGTIDLDPHSGVDNHVKSPLKTHTYISKLAPNGHYWYGKTISGSYPLFTMGNVYATGLSVTSAGNVYITGYFDKKVDFNPGTGAYNVTAVGNNDAFICGLNPSGNFWSINRIESHYSNGYVRNNAIDMSANEDIYTTGRLTRTGDFNPSGYPYYVISLGGFDMFTHKLERYTLFPNPFFKSNSETENAEIEVFPNPTSNFINLRLKGDKDAKVSLVSMTGQVVYSSVHTIGLSTISLEHLSSGTYMLLVTQEEKTTRMKIVKQ
ncbi:MAG: T9SS type A sorting domain-containing protein [Crocinitomicaceae bacterium]